MMINGIGVGANGEFILFYFVHFAITMGIYPMGNSGRFLPKKASCNRVALPNAN